MTVDQLRRGMMFTLNGTAYQITQIRHYRYVYAKSPANKREMFSVSAVLDAINNG